MKITNARIVSPERVIDSGTVTISADGRIAAVEAGLRPVGPDTIDAGGRLLMPALINAHSHLYSTLARGMTLGGRPPRNFRDVLRKLWWRLDRALNPEDIYYSALTGLIASAKCGVGTLIDHHSSPNACAGSLDQVERAYQEVGMRGALCYETSDRNGVRSAAAGIAENIRFLERKHDGRIGGAFGLHASFTLSDRTLRKCVEANSSLGTGFHVHVAEDACDAGAVRRLADRGVMDERTLAAHCVHVTTRDAGILAERRVNVIHNPQSNCNNAVGMARIGELMRRGVTVGLGSDGYSPSLWEEFKTAIHVQKLVGGGPSAGLAAAYAAAFGNNREIVRKVWGWEVGRIEPGARADLILVDYFPPTPLHDGNVAGHVLFGIASSAVHSLLVDGRMIVQNGQCVTVDERAVAEKAAAQARSLWRRFETVCQPYFRDRRIRRCCIRRRGRW